jgi:hypothetical protein
VVRYNDPYERMGISISISTRGLLHRGTGPVFAVAGAWHMIASASIDFEVWPLHAVAYGSLRIGQDGTIQLLHLGRSHPRDDLRHRSLSVPLYRSGISVE